MFRKFTTTGMSNLETEQLKYKEKGKRWDNVYPFQLFYWKSIDKSDTMCYK